VSAYPQRCCSACRFAYDAPWLEQRLGTDCEKPGDDGWVYECRRFPPAGRDAVNDGTGSTDGWPMVMACDWCGEWREHEEPVVDDEQRDRPVASAVDGPANGAQVMEARERPGVATALCMVTPNNSMRVSE
jgi:hypothetical protein